MNGITQLKVEQTRNTASEIARHSGLGLSGGHQRRRAEDVCWCLSDNPLLARQCLEGFRMWDHATQPHWASILPEGGDLMASHNVYFEDKAMVIPKWQGWAKAEREKLDELITEDVV